LIWATPYGSLSLKWSPGLKPFHDLKIQLRLYDGGASSLFWVVIKSLRSCLVYVRSLRSYAKIGPGRYLDWSRVFFFKNFVNFSSQVLSENRIKVNMFSKSASSLILNSDTRSLNTSFKTCLPLRVYTLLALKKKHIQSRYHSKIWMAQMSPVNSISILPAPAIP